ncbi:MAG: hypothetical protein IKS41_06595 [Alphaproteobacteria bacterium]|nr:hypothetical protein [Alphaproteobacteria bacterium]
MIEELVEIGAMTVVGGGMIFGVTNIFYYTEVHHRRAQRVAALKDLSQTEKKAYHHWFCYPCHWENKRAKAFDTSVLKPDVTHVTVKPMWHCDGVRQVVMDTTRGERIRYVPASHNEVTIETQKGKEVFDLRPPLAPGLKIATAPAPVVNGTNTLAATAQNTRE